MTNDELAELEATKAALSAARAELQALKDRQNSSTAGAKATGYAQAIVLAAIAGMVAWQTYLIIELRSVIV